MRGIPPFGENKKAPGGWKNPVPGADGRAFAVVSPEVGHTGPTAAVSFLRGVGLPLGENGAYWGGQVAHSLFTIWERMGRQTHQSYQCETYAFIFLLGSVFLRRTERSELSSSQLVKKQGGEVRRGGRRLTAAFRSAPGFVPQNLPRKRAHYPLVPQPLKWAQELGNLSKKPPKTFTQSPTGKRGENKKAGPPAWNEPGKRPRQKGKSDQKCSGIPHPIYGKRVCEPSGKKPANPHKI